MFWHAFLRTYVSFTSFSDDFSILGFFFFFLVMKSAELPLTLSQDTFGIWGSSIKGLLICDESTISPSTRVWGLRFQHQNGESFGETVECNQIEFVRNIS